MRKSITAIILTLVILFLPVSVIAEGSIFLTASSRTVSAGQNVTVTVSIARQEIENYQTVVNYDPDVLQYVSVDQGATSLANKSSNLEQAGTLRVGAFDAKAVSATRLFSVTFKTLKVQSTSVRVMDVVVGTQYPPDEAIAITVTEPLSGDNRLESLQVTNATRFSPEFASGTTKYTVRINANVNQLVIIAKPRDGDAQVAYSGNRNLKDGSVVQVIVTAANQQKRTYTLTIDKAAAPTTTTTRTTTVTTTTTTTTQPTTPATTPVGTTAENTTTASTTDTQPIVTTIPVSPPTDTSPASVTLPDGSVYQIIAAPADEVPPDGFRPLSAELDGRTVPAYRNDDGVTLYYLFRNGSGDGFYTYDQTSRTYTFYAQITTPLQQFLVLTPDENVTVPKGWTATPAALDGAMVSFWRPEAGSGISLSAQVFLAYLKDAQGNAGFYLYDQGNNRVFPYEDARVAGMLYAAAQPSGTNATMSTTVSETAAVLAPTTKGTGVSTIWIWLTGILGLAVLALLAAFVWRGGEPVPANRPDGYDDEDLSDRPAPRLRPGSDGVKKTPKMLRTSRYSNRRPPIRRI